MPFKLGDKVRFYAVMRKEHRSECPREVETLWKSVDIPPHVGIIVGKRTLSEGYLHIGTRDPYDDDGTYFNVTGGVSVWLVATNLTSTCYVHPANIDPVE